MKRHLKKWVKVFLLFLLTIYLIALPITAYLWHQTGEEYRQHLIDNEQVLFGGLMKPSKNECMFIWDYGKQKEGFQNPTAKKPAMWTCTYAIKKGFFWTTM